METDTPHNHPPSDLNNAAKRLASRLRYASAEQEARGALLDHLIRDAETWLHRRAAWNARDKAIYRTGAALEPRGGHLLNDIQLSGLDALGARAVLLLIPIAIQYPDRPLSQLMATLFDSAHGPLIAEWGRWSRLHWLAELHRNETEEFMQTKVGSDPRAAWRTRAPTRRQMFLAQEICRALDVNLPAFANRGEALDRIVIDGLLQRVLEPSRLRILLADVLDRSDTAEEGRRQDHDRVRRERIGAEARLSRLLDLVADGIMRPRDPMFAAKLAEVRTSIAGLSETEQRLAKQIGRPSGRIDDAAVERFGERLRSELTGANSELKRAYVRIFVSGVVVNDNEILIAGSKAALEAGAAKGNSDALTSVPSFDRKWCGTQSGANGSQPNFPVNCRN